MPDPAAVGGQVLNVPVTEVAGHLIERVTALRRIARITHPDRCQYLIGILGREADIGPERRKLPGDLRMQPGELGEPGGSRGSVGASSPPDPVRGSRCRSHSASWSAASVRAALSSSRDGFPGPADRALARFLSPCRSRSGMSPLPVVASASARGLDV